MKKGITFSIVLLLILGFTPIVAGCGDEDSEEKSKGEEGYVGNKPDVSGSISGHNYVDLGLSVKWATCNIGATSPEEVGNFYAWCDDSENNTFRYEDSKYYSRHKIGNTYYFFKNIGTETTGTSYDVAKKKWGADWRTPTSSEMYELVNSCTTKWTSYNGALGRIFTGPNGNSIFLPAGGYMDENGLHYTQEGYYWSSTNDSYGNYFNSTGNPDRDVGINFDSDDRDVGALYVMSRVRGFNIRPVSGNIKTNGSGGGGSGSGNDGDTPYVTSFDFTATKNSITVKFMCSEKPTKATIKYGDASPSKTVSSSISGKQVSATVKNLKSGTKYYFQCTISNNAGTSTSDVFPAITNY